MSGKCDEENLKTEAGNQVGMFMIIGFTLNPNEDFPHSF